MWKVLVISRPLWTVPIRFQHVVKANLIQPIALNIIYKKMMYTFIKSKATSLRFYFLFQIMLKVLKHFHFLMIAVERPWLTMMTTSGLSHWQDRLNIHRLPIPKRADRRPWQNRLLRSTVARSSAGSSTCTPCPSGTYNDTAGMGALWRCVAMRTNEFVLGIINAWNRRISPARSCCISSFPFPSPHTAWSGL